MLPEFDWNENFTKFIDSLPIKSQVKLIAVIKNIELHGLLIAFDQQWIKKLRKFI